MTATSARPARTAAAAVAAVALLALGACSTLSTGMGGGDLTRQGQSQEPVLFSWRSHDGGITGTMVATLPDATYQGRFFQITQQTERESVVPLWDGWTEGWTDWPYWGWGPGGMDTWTQFSTRYTGKVLANLQTDDGKRMRCRLHLAQPIQGMAGGGDGECQLQGGGTIRARF
nr:hypothetical protein [Variovorax boronicumulans]